ncbi:TIR domain-containing protein [Fodinibius salsisoli]|uniref:TIR domain-containing protein n=1 Tax=Fodinibius salsisoli TaxID=2820877 RepID=A0ABT3PHT7_9BACT|nr:TIR domain-containing protein [Fodinibius salsisoli]MCW9705477.1 TIR domain-containing protein [Fodinibius salsisoli]
MSRAFLSHSSHDKGFIDEVADELGRDNIVYDKYSFEAGEKTLDEIIEGMSSSDIFILFLSDKSLQSTWVRREILIAKTYFDSEKIDKIYPLIIDRDVDHKDKRIPNWLNKEYNLKLVARPGKVKSLIKQRLKEISWKKHPILREKENIFVGRNDLVKEFELRVDNINRPIPKAAIASGLKNIGRKSFLNYSLVKSSILTKDSYAPSIIDIDPHESIEDFILKVYDLGFSKKRDFKSFMSMTIEEKQDLAADLVREIQEINEILFIEDVGGIVRPGGRLVDWFRDLLTNNKLINNKFTFGIASKFRSKKHIIGDKDNIFYVEVPELSINERTGLFRRYLDILDVNLLREDLNIFLERLTGFPEQIFFAADLIAEEGKRYAKEHINLISDYSSEKVSTIISKYEDNDEALELLRLLAEFDFVSYEFLFQLLDNEKNYTELINEFINIAICENLGRGKEYIRLNDTVKDYIIRGEGSILHKYRDKLKKHLQEFVNNEDLWVEDISNFFYSMKEALNNGFSPPDKYLIPSHFLKTMVDKYQRESQYGEVIQLADRVLKNTKNLDESIKREIIYWLCLSLARLRDDRFLEEVQYFQGKEYNFLLGFYYRMIGKHSYSIDRHLSVLDEDPNFQRSKRELVQSYINMEDYEAALTHAKSNYEGDRNNPFHIQAYFKCLVHQVDENTHSLKVLERLVEELNGIKTKKAREMYLTMKCTYELKVLDDPDKALATIEQAINQFPYSKYPLFRKFDVLEKLEDTEGMSRIIRTLKNMSIDYGHLSVLNARVLANRGQYDAAILEIDNLNYYPDKTKERLKERMKSG